MFPCPGCDPRTMPFGLRIRDEKKSLVKMQEYMEQGLVLLESAPKQNEKLKELINLGKFINRSVITGIHAKDWFVLKYRLYSTAEAAEYGSILDEMEELLYRELKNTEATIPLVEADSRLGWEPSMLYMTDRWHLEWKIRQVRYVLDYEIRKHRTSLSHVLND